MRYGNYIPASYSGQLARIPRRKHKAPKCDNALRRLKKLDFLLYPLRVEKERAEILYPMHNGRGDLLSAKRIAKRQAKTSK